ncbi:MAG TPA: hypothetical protein PK604_06975 [Acetivibrio clariflavus]|nr:hypothetical protein [Acetivibrio clariflavus]
MIEKVKNIYYRGLLSSCNYSCSYCCFARKKPGKTELIKDEESLKKFCDFIDNTEFKNKVSIFLLPMERGLYMTIMSKLSEDLLQIQNVNIYPVKPI